MSGPRYVLGIDPGIRGAVAVLEARSGAIIVVADTPVVNKQYYLPGMRDLLVVYSPAIAWVERQQAFPRQGVVSTFKTGMGFGLWLGLLAGLEIPHYVVWPLDWQREMLEGVEGENPKIRSLAAVAKLWPGYQLRRSEHGYSDAILLAEYGRRRLVVDAPAP